MDHIGQLGLPVPTGSPADVPGGVRRDIHVYLNKAHGLRIEHAPALERDHLEAGSGKLLGDDGADKSRTDNYDIDGF